MPRELLPLDEGQRTYTDEEFAEVLRQAAEQFEIFTNQQAPRTAMRTVLDAALRDSD